MQQKALANEIRELKEFARNARSSVLKMLYTAQAGHPGASFSEMEILVTLYFQIMKIRPAQPDWSERDRFILSKGHGAAGLYAVLAERGYFPKEDLVTFDRINSYLQGHPDMRKTPGLDISTGSLGQGLSIGCGMALGAKMEKKDIRVFVLLGDGEMQEGQVWEAVMFAAKHRLNNLIAVIDYNKLQMYGTVDEIVPVEPLEQKMQLFGWNTKRVDGHDFSSLLEALQARTNEDKPMMIVADTIKGKGVSFMENDLNWHSGIMNRELYEKALQEIKNN